MFTECKNILNRTIGLDLASVGESVLSSALKHRMSAKKCDDDTYLELLRTDKKELFELIEEVVVHETWFFRDIHPFELLVKDASEKKIEKYKVLCAPCSSGEEPYSAAMALSASGMDRSSFSVTGVDISSKAIDKALSAFYGNNSFRNDLPLYAQKFFKESRGGKTVSEEIKRSVMFAKGNILYEELPQTSFDAIFCRNFMIYLDVENREKLLKIIDSRLKPDGILFVGHAEAMPLLHRDFTPVRSKGTFAFRKKISAPFAKAGTVKNYTGKISEDTDKYEIFNSSATLKSEDSWSMDLKPSAVKTRADLSEKTDRKESDFSLNDTRRADFSIVRELADRGKVEEALKICDSLLLENGPDAEAFYLEGLLHETLGNLEQAGEFYRKSLYLNPQHTETLAHLLLMAEAEGDFRQAAILRGRLDRSTAGGE